MLNPTRLTEEEFAGVRYQIEGELVPVLHVELGSVPIYFEHHILLWKDVSVNIRLKALAGMGKRILAGMPIFMTEATGPGRIAFSRDGPGQVFPVHLHAGQGLDVREHQWLAATDQIGYSFKRVKGAANILFGGTGLFVDTFHCDIGDGVLWLHGYGNCFEVYLGPGEQIDIEPGGWIYKDTTVTMETVWQPLTTGVFANGGQFVFNRFSGPGHVALPSMYYHSESGTG
jgi:uncharacterized protein (AIM24 family)